MFLQTEQTAQYIIVTSIQTLIKQQSLLFNRMTQRETTRTKVQAWCTFTPTAIEYFSKAVIPNNINLTIFRHRLVIFQISEAYISVGRQYLSMSYTAVSSFPPLPKTDKTLLKLPWNFPTAVWMSTWHELLQKKTPRYLSLTVHWSTTLSSLKQLCGFLPPNVIHCVLLALELVSNACYSIVHTDIN